MQVALDVLQLDQRRQLSLARRLQLAGVLAQLRRNELVTQPVVDLYLVRETQLLLGLDDGDRVLGDRETVLHRALSQRDVVILRAGEVLEQVAVGLGRDDAEIEAEAFVGEDSCLRRAVRHHLDHPLELREVLREGLRILRRGDDVEVPEGFLAPARTPGLGNLHGRGVLTKNRDDGEQRTESVTEEPPIRRFLLLLGERLQDPFLRLCAEPRECAQLLLLGRPFQFLDRRHAELAPDSGRGLRTQAGETHEADDLRRDNLLALRQGVHLAVLDDLDDLFLDRLADALQLLGAAVEGQFGNGTGRLANSGGRASVGEHAERGLSLELEQVGEQLELIRYVDIPRQSLGHPLNIRRCLEPSSASPRTTSARTSSRCCAHSGTRAFGCS